MVQPLPVPFQPSRPEGGDGGNLKFFMTKHINRLHSTRLPIPNGASPQPDKACRYWLR